MQNLGARVGYWGRNWSSAGGRLGRIGVWCVAFAESAVRAGAALAGFTDGASDLTKRAARFLEEVLGEPAPDGVREPAPDGGGGARGPKRSAAPQGESPPAPSANPERPAAPAPSRESEPPPAPPPRPASEPRSTRARPSRAPKSAPAPKPATPPPLPDDLPVYLQIELRAVQQTSRPLPEIVRRLILQVTEVRGWTRPADLAAWLGFDTNYLKRRYLAPMTKERLLERLYPDSRSDPRQAYRAARATGVDASPDG